ncbi:MAG: flagellar hook assembly protein FlgD [Hyphomicrobiales bacterium]|nr:flagellar hook assembly protein FlgD [Hyphomicrobiales bacterium]
MAILSSAAATSSASTLTQSGQSKQQLDEDLNQFLTLLTTQLQNQDPLDPMDATEFTSQLVQFASVEQQIYQNSNLEKLYTLQKNSQVVSMVNYLGTTIEAKGDAFYLEDGTSKFTYTLAEKAASTTITIRNASGTTIATFDGEIDIGKHGAVWDGTNSLGYKVEDGLYQVTVLAKDSEGKPLDVTTTVFGKVTGAGSDDGEVSLYVDGLQFSLDDVLSVAETPASATTTTTGDGAANDNETTDTTQTDTEDDSAS